ncbi:MDR/zinc-dependent alcohol dehydrogenase-like family protein [Streptomyces olivoreticuli]|uniref:MDR/zinc-dependent alcohol dehydrogenase-like family protein n=1 Tax=Streptomyces olivoreticuli TaxID=68246 RepID=UPI0013C347F7|nr:medium chain dehydrogenase/reductase family protein [Streptomyces olivoreticuli]
MSTAVAPDDAQAGAGEQVPLPVHRAIVREGGAVRVRRRPTLAPAAGELSIAPLVAGLCGTDLQMLRGLRDDPAPVIGHEGVARVVAAGHGVDSALAPGTLVVVNPTHPTDPSFLLGHNVDGLLQERTLIPATAVHGGQVIALSEAPEPDLAALLEPLATVRYAFSVLAVARPRTLVVIGDGTVGHLAVRAARHWLGDGVRTVLVHHTRQGREWSARSRIRADVLLTQGLDSAGELTGAFADGPVAVLLATPRDATLSCLETVLRAARGEVTVDLLGGLPPGAGTDLLARRRPRGRPRGQLRGPARSRRDGHGPLHHRRPRPPVRPPRCRQRPSARFGRRVVPVPRALPRPGHPRRRPDRGGGDHGPPGAEPGPERCRTPPHQARGAHRTAPPHHPGELMPATTEPLEGQRGLVVGGSTGIGRAIADAWARAGMDVLVLETDHRAGDPARLAENLARARAHARTVTRTVAPTVAPPSRPADEDTR